MLELLLLLNLNSKNAVKLARETCGILFYHTAFLSFWKSKRLIGEIKYGQGKLDKNLP